MAVVLLISVDSGIAQDDDWRDALGVAKTRVESGDLLVISELREAGDDESVAILWTLYLNYRFSSERERFPKVARLAFEAVREMNGHTRLVRGNIEKLTAEKYTVRKRSYEFDFLVKLGTDEALDVMMRYLDDGRMAETLEERRQFRETETDYAPPFGSNSELAMSRLRIFDHPDLEGAPKREHSWDALNKWREWKRAEWQSRLDKRLARNIVEAEQAAKETRLASSERSWKKERAERDAALAAELVILEREGRDTSLILLAMGVLMAGLAGVAGFCYYLFAR